MMRRKDDNVAFQMDGCEERGEGERNVFLVKQYGNVFFFWGEEFENIICVCICMCAIFICVFVHV